jgi:hypothetical protein
MSKEEVEVLSRDQEEQLEIVVTYPANFQDPPRKTGSSLGVGENPSDPSRDLGDAEAAEYLRAPKSKQLLPWYHHIDEKVNKDG